MAVTLKAENRDISVSNNRLRKDKIIPATVYGPDFEPKSITVGLVDLTAVYKQVRETMVLNLEIQGEQTSVIIRELQKDPVHDQVLSVSFMKVKMDHVIGVSVPVSFKGVSMAVKNNLGFLVTPISEIAIKCLPANIPSGYEVDISILENVGDSILVKDINLGEGVTLAPGLDTYVVIATVVPPQKEIRTDTVASTTEVDPATAEGSESKVEDTVKS